ncbi:glycosyl transferase family 1 [Candidatus Desulfofervidus auxilii]|nr:glycosyltransferase family 1 protein [Candidatus Desulfofervidus auxilii]AMM40600.1 glycosyl transferase family 1 [Candidatus Desulfofervidus auxilii]
MIIGIDIRWLSFKGTGLYTYLSNLLTVLLEIDRKNQYIFFYNESKEKIFPYQKNLTYKRVSAKPFLFKEKFLFFEILKRNKLDIFFEPHFNLPLLLPKKLPVILTIHDLTPLIFPQFFSFFERIYFRSILTHAIKRANHIIAVSKYTKDCLKKRFSKLPKISVIYQGRPKLNNAESTTDLSIPLPYILYFGNKRGYKNYKRVIEAYGMLRTRLSQYHLVIVGINGQSSENIIFLKNISETEKALLYKKASLFVFPSLNEGFGFPLLEAMQVGVPVITSNLSSLPEVAGRAAYFVNPFEVDEISEGMYKLLTNKGLRKELIKRGLQRSRIFSWNETAQKYLKIFQEYASFGCHTCI